MTVASETPVAAYRGQFQATRGNLPGAGQDWADTLREAGMRRFESTGFPTRRVEAWKYTDLRKLAKLDLQPAPVTVNGLSPDLQAEMARAKASAHAAVFVNGHFRADLSRLDALPAGVRLAPLRQLLEAGDPLVAAHLGQVLPDAARDRPLLDLNTAFMEDGFVLHVTRGTVLEEPIRISLLTERSDAPIAVFPRNLIVAEPGSAATVVEAHVSVDGTAGLGDSVTEIVIGDGARLRHYKRQEDGDGTNHLATILADIGRDATYDNFALTRGAELSRNDIHARLAGRGGDCRLCGAYLGDRRQVLDTTTVIEHASADCTSRQVYKGVLGDAARGVFQGRVVVARDAQRTDGHQLSNALLLSPSAEIDAKPELEIYADDVKCSHGATAGEIDADALFYLRCRGIGEAEARALLVEAFVREAMDDLADANVRAEFEQAVTGWLANLGSAS